MKPRHPGFAAHLDRHGLADGELRSDGSVELLFGDRMRVLARPGVRGELVLESRLIPLDPSTRSGEQRMQLALETAASRWLRSSEALVLAPERGMLLLQQQVPADCSADEVEASLVEFVGAVGFWRRHLGAL